MREQHEAEQRAESSPRGFRHLGRVWRCYQCEAVRSRLTAKGTLAGGRRPSRCETCGQSEDGFEPTPVYECERCGRWVYVNETNEHQESCEE